MGLVIIISFTMDNNSVESVLIRILRSSSGWTKAPQIDRQHRTAVKTSQEFLHLINLTQLSLNVKLFLGGISVYTRPV